VSTYRLIVTLGGVDVEPYAPRDNVETLLALFDCEYDRAAKRLPGFGTVDGAHVHRVGEVPWRTLLRFDPEVGVWDVVPQLGVEFNGGEAILFCDVAGEILHGVVARRSPVSRFEVEVWRGDEPYAFVETTDCVRS
jgi:hypothetical protein